MTYPDPVQGKDENDPNSLKLLVFVSADIRKEKTDMLTDTAITLLLAVHVAHMG